MSLTKIPHYSTCFVCGDKNDIGLHLEFWYDESKKEIISHFKPETWWDGYKGIVHGGLQAAILDEGMGWTIYPLTGDYYLTMELTVRYRFPLESGKEYEFRGWIIKQFKDYFFTKGEIVDTQGKVYAKASGKYKRMAPTEG